MAFQTNAFQGNDGDPAGGLWLRGVLGQLSGPHLRYDRTEGGPGSCFGTRFGF